MPDVFPIPRWIFGYAHLYAVVDLDSQVVEERSISVTHFTQRCTRHTVCKILTFSSNQQYCFTTLSYCWNYQPIRLANLVKLHKSWQSVKIKKNTLNDSNGLTHKKDRSFPIKLVFSRIIIMNIFTLTLPIFTFRTGVADLC